MNRQVDLSQVIKIHRKNIKTESGPLTIKYINPLEIDQLGIKAIINNSPHLKDLSRIFNDETHNKIILICENLNFGISTVGKIGKIMTGFLEKSCAMDTGFDFGDDDFSFHGSFDELPHEEVEEEIVENFIIAFESEFDPNCNSVGETSMIERMGSQAPVLDYSEFKNLLFVTDGLFSLTQKSMDFLQSFQGNIAVVIQNSNKNMGLVDQLAFESNFEVYDIKDPSTDFLETQFIDIAKHKGFVIHKDVNIKNLIAELIKFRGHRFQEFDLSIYLDKAIKSNHSKSKEIKIFPPLIKDNGDLSIENYMDNIIGLDDIKNNISKILYKNIHLRQMSEKGHRVLDNYKHIAFEGNPGTCKTTMARALARLYLDNNIVSNGFFEYGREDIVGRYLGETSQKVSRIFKMAKDGVIFIDEIGSLLAGGSIDSYGEEALNAIIRNMENQPDTMVIMATYPDEMERLLSVNPGLKSRLSDIIHFPDYSDAELWDIFESFALKSGYSLEEGSEDIVKNYFNKLKHNESFGNGREARKLFENAISHLSLELFKNKSKKIDRISKTAIIDAVDYLSSNIKNNVKQKMGFTIKRTGE